MDKIEQELQRVREQMTRLEYSDDQCYTNGRMHRLRVLEHQLRELASVSSQTNSETPPK